MAEGDVRKGMPDVALDRAEFERRFLARFYDPEFAALDPQLRDVTAVAWQAYSDYHKSPRTRPAGPQFADPNYELAVEWLAARDAIALAAARQRDSGAPSRVLLINGSPRSDQTCPGEVSKTWRLLELARDVLERRPGFEVDVLDLSRLASEFGRVIYPCKGCVSTAQPLCHWPCSCYPNHALMQNSDWMAEIYPRWVAAHAVMIFTPVHWYQAPSALKLMIDRLVCADGGNPDPTSTSGKDPAKAKALEQAGWDYPRHLAGRIFGLVVHGDAGGAESVRRGLSDWLQDMGLIPADHRAQLDRYVGYLAPYATSHDDLDRDEKLQEEVRAAATIVAQAVAQTRSGAWPKPAAGVAEPRPK